MIDGGEVVAKAFAQGVMGGSFYEPKHGVIWDVLVKLWTARKPIDVACVAEEMKAGRVLEEVGGYAFLTQVSSRVPAAAQAGFFVG